VREFMVSEIHGSYLCGRHVSGTKDASSVGVAESVDMMAEFAFVPRRAKVHGQDGKNS
jgi:hypothetical protein